MKGKMIIFTAMGVLAMAGCSKEAEISIPSDEVNVPAGEQVVLKINVAGFPAYDDVDSKAVGTEDPGKTAWIAGDEILMRAGSENTVITFDGQYWTAAGSLQTNGTVEIGAWYAPDYEWGSGAEPVLKAGKSAGMDEYLHFSTVADIEEGITIDFSGCRNYSRLRIAGEASSTVSVKGDFVPVNGSAAFGTEAVALDTDANGNAFIFGSWEANAGLQFIDGPYALSKTLAAASTDGQGYVFNAANIASQFNAFIDPRDGEEYRICRIAGAVWFADNLRATVYSDGIPIENGVRFYGDNEQDYLSDGRDFRSMRDIFGGYYNFNGMMRRDEAAQPDEKVQGACPTGWHVPTNAEWDNLINSCPDPSNPSDALKNPEYWQGTAHPGQNLIGFNAAPAGYIWEPLSNRIDDEGNYCYFWSASEGSNDPTTANTYSLNGNSNAHSCWGFNKGRGFSVRCVMD